MASLVLNGSTSGSITISSPAVSGSNTLSLPANTGTVLTTASTFAGTGPAFSAYQSSSQTLSGSTDTKITFTTEEFDTNNNFASSTFTATVAGHYLFAGAMQINALAGNTFLTGHSTIYKNGSRFAVGQYSGVSSTNIVSPVSCIISLNANDTVEFYATTFATGAGCFIINAIQTTYFTGCLIRSA